MHFGTWTWWIWSAESKWFTWLWMWRGGWCQAVWPEYLQKPNDLLGFSNTTISWVYRDWSEREKTSSEWQISGRKCLVDVRAHRRHWHTKIQKSGKMLPGLMSLHFCCSIRMVGSEFSISNIKSWLYSALYEWFRLLLVVIVRGELWAKLVAIEHHLNATACLRIVADHVHRFMTIG